MVLTALHDLRFQIGLVSAAHLVARLNGQGSTTRSTGEASQLLISWAMRRLSSGLEPQTVAENLVAVRDRLSGRSSEAIADVLAFFCLDGRPIRGQPSSREEHRPRTRTLSRISLRYKPRTLPIPQWLSPRHGRVKTTIFDPERRPSLPILLVPAATQSMTSLPTRFDPETHPARHSLPSSNLSSPSSTPGSSGRRPSPLGRRPSPPTQASPLLNLLGLSDMPTERVPLVDHLLELRYRLGSDADSWYLGCGRDKAIDFLRGVDAAGEPHKTGVVSQLRYSFGLPAVSSPSDEHSPSPREAHTRGSVPLHQRDVSFDLAQYLDDIGPIDGEDKVSPTVSQQVHATVTQPRLISRVNSSTSISTISSVMTNDTITTIGDTVSESDFSIREVTRELPKSAKATAYRFPARFLEDATATDDLSSPPLPPALNYPRFAKSMPNVNDMYTRLPNRMNCRRQSTKDSRLPPLLPAFNLETNRPAPGLPSVVPSNLCSPNSPPQQSPTAKGYTFPPIASPMTFPPMSAPATGSFAHSPRTPSMDGDDRSRRQMYRQCVIVDGTRHSPHASACSLRKAPQDLTALGSILALFRPGAEHLSSEAVESKLLEAVKNEEERHGAFGELFDAEARARLAWLLEQVGQEVSRPDVDHSTDIVAGAP